MFPFEALEEVYYYFADFGEVYFEDAGGSFACETGFEDLAELGGDVCQVTSIKSETEARKEKGNFLNFFGGGARHFDACSFEACSCNVEFVAESDVDV